MSVPKFTLYSKPEYYADLIKRLGKLGPGDRFMTATMVIRPWHPEVAAVLDAMVAAAERGVQVTLITDSFIFLLDDDQRYVPGPLLYRRQLGRRRLPGRFQQQRRALERLKSAGGRYVVTNPPSHLLSNPYAGRCHLKFTVIDDRYYIGGCNLESYRVHDSMVGDRDQRVADWLVELGERMLKTGSARQAIGNADATFELGQNMTFFLDAGEPKRSLILDRAMDLIDAARDHVVFVCQHFPGGEVGKHLLAAKLRGAKVTIIYNHPDQQPFPKSLLHYAYDWQQRHHLPESFFANAIHRGSFYMHEKLIATEHGAIVGSHNFVEQGVNFGTAEIALLVRDPEFSRRVTQKALAQLSQ